MGGVISTGIKIVSTVGGAIVDTFESTAGWFFSGVGAIVELVLSIPVVGAVLKYARNIFHTFVWGASSFLDIGFGVFGFFPEKRMRIAVIIQRDEEGVLVADRNEVLATIQKTIDVLKVEANVRVLPVGPFKYSSPFQAKPKASRDYIFEELNPSDADTLVVDCGYPDFVNDSSRLGGFKFNMKLSSILFFSNGRRMIGYGTPMAAFAVREFLDADGAGCSLGPLTDYVTVKFSKDNTRILAHELGHACNLWHTSDDTNLMSPAGPGTKLRRDQKILFRTSRHVTFF